MCNWDCNIHYKWSPLLTLTTDLQYYPEYVHNDLKGATAQRLGENDQKEKSIVKQKSLSDIASELIKDAKLKQDEKR